MTEPHQPPDVDNPGGPPPKRRRLLKFVLFVVVLLVGLVAALPSLLSSHWTRDLIHAWLEENVDRKVDFADLDVSWSGRVELHDLRVFDKDPTRPPVLSAPVIELEAPLLPLLRKRLEVRKFLLTDAVVRVGLGEEGDAGDVVKRRKVRRKRTRKKGETEPEVEERLILPRMSVPVEVRNLTLVFAGADGVEARQEGITFDGHLTTRDGPTTFDLDVPDGAGGGIRVTGETTLFDEGGVLLDPEDRTARAKVTIRDLDADRHRDLLALFLPDLPLAGVVNGTVSLNSRGSTGSGDVDVEVRDAAVGEAVSAPSGLERKDLGRKDLVMKGRFEAGGDRLSLTGFRVEAEGLLAEANLSGAWSALQGTASVHMDLARVASGLARLGIEIPGTLAGKVDGDFRFTPSPNRGTGSVVLSGFRAEGLVAGGPPVTVDEAKITLRVTPTAERFRLDQLLVTLPDLTVEARGARQADGAFDLAVDVNGDLGRLLTRVRDLGFLPGGFSVNGVLAGRILASRAAGDDAPLIEVETLRLSEDDVLVTLKGRRNPEGVLDFTASGSGDLGKLLGRARDGTAGSGSPNAVPVEHVKGRFDFAATVKGRPDRLAISLDRFDLEGDVSLHAGGGLAPDGTLQGRVNLASDVQDLLTLTRRLGVLDHDVRLGGKVTASARIAGTRSEPAVPVFEVSVTDGPVLARASGSVSAQGAVDAQASVSADVRRLLVVAKQSGFLERDVDLEGTLRAELVATGTRDAVAVPKFKVSLSGGAVDASVEGEMKDDRTVQAAVQATGAIDDVFAILRANGYMEREVRTGGNITLRGIVRGPADALEVPQMRLTVSGPFDVQADGKMDTERTLHVSAGMGGKLQSLADVAAAFTGEGTRTLPGTFAASLRADGPVDRLTFHLGNLQIRGEGFRVDGSGNRDADGNTTGHLDGDGRLGPILDFAHSFGQATNVHGTGGVKFNLDGTLRDGIAEASATVTATDLLIREPEIGGAPLREPRLVASLSSLRYHVEDGRLEPMKLLLELDGARLDVTAEMPAAEPVEGDAPAPRVVDVKADVLLERAFADRHPELLAGAVFDRVSGPVSFRGDVADGRERAGTWTGKIDLSATGLVSEYAVVQSARLTGRIEDGVLRIDPFDAQVNGGTVHATADLGLVGKHPDHSIDFKCDKVRIDGRLAPLLARISPLFAVGETGTAGGTLSADGKLTASGTKSRRVKRTLSGGGTMTVLGAYMESNNWMGQVLEVVGVGKRLEIADMTIDYRVENGKVRTGEVPLGANNLAMKLAGEVGLDGSLDYLLRIKPLSDSGAFSKFATFLDKEGFLPLGLKGDLSSPSLKFPSLKDALTGESGLGGLLDRLRGKDKDDDKKDKADGSKRGGKKGRKGKGKGGKKKKGGRKKGGGKKKGDPPPPPPPDDGTGDGKDDPPPPPPPGHDDPPPPPKTQVRVLTEVP